MDFQNKHFQEFLKMRDCDVEKLLKRHAMSAKYFFKDDSIYVNCGSCKNRILLDNGQIIGKYDADYYQLKFDMYLQFRKQYIKEYFKNIGTDATLNFIERRAKFYYGEENVWKDSENNCVIIHFPEILITNEVEDSHLMKDLYFRIQLRNGRFERLHLARTTINENEYGKYLFSHLSETNLGEWNSSLCFGATELNSWISEAKDKNDFRLIDRIIASIEGYLSWESLKGKPYKYMEVVRSPRIDGRLAGINITEDKVYNALSVIYNSNIKLNYKLIDSDGVYKIQITNIYDIDDILKNERIEQYYRYNDNSYDFLEKLPIPEINPDSSNIYFKDKLVPIIIEPSDTEFVKESRCHVTLLSMVINKIENQLLNYLIIKENE